MLVSLSRQCPLVMSSRLIGWEAPHRFVLVKGDGTALRVDGAEWMKLRLLQKAERVFEYGSPSFHSAHLFATRGLSKRYTNIRL